MEQFGTFCSGFLLGVLTGAAGKYYADRFTDRRREGENRRQQRNTFRETRQLMPELIAEMKADLSKAGQQLVREFYLTRKSLQLNIRQPHFLYYEDDHGDLQGNAHVLENRGYILDVTSGNLPKYRMTEEFVDLLLKEG